MSGFTSLNRRDADASYKSLKAETYVSASLVQANIFIGSFSGSLSGSVQNCVSASYAATASMVIGYTTTASFNSFTSSYLTNSASFNIQITNLANSTASFAVTGSNIFRGNQVISGSLTATGSIIAPNFIGTASYAISASSAFSSSYAYTASYAVFAISTSYYDTSSLLQSSSFSAYTSSLVGLTFLETGSSSYSGSMTWTATASPSGSNNNTYQWTRVGKMTTIRANLRYTGSGIAVTKVIFPMPPGCPTPYEPVGFGSASEILYYGAGGFATTSTALVSNNSKVGIMINSTDTGYSIFIAVASVTLTVAYITITYSSTDVALP